MTACRYAKYQGNVSKERLLREECEVGHVACVLALLDEGVDLNARTPFGNTALMVACVRGHQPVVEVLLAAGADVNAANDAGYTALHRCPLGGNMEIVKMLLQHGADVNARLIPDPETHGTRCLSMIERAQTGGFLELEKLLKEFALDSVDPEVTMEYQDCQTGEVRVPDST